MCYTGLRLIHEMKSRKVLNNVIRLDAEAADGTKFFKAYNSFSVDLAPGYTAHVGTRNSSLIICEYVCSGIEVHIMLRI